MKGNPHAHAAPNVGRNPHSFNRRCIGQSLKGRTRHPEMDPARWRESRERSDGRDGAPAFKFRDFEMSVAGSEECRNGRCGIDYQISATRDDEDRGTRGHRRRSRGHRVFVRPILSGRSCFAWRIHSIDKPATSGPYRIKRIRAAVWIDILDRVHKLDCASGNVADCATDRSRCADRRGHFIGADWSGCPVRSIIDDIALQSVMALDRQSKLSPISGWPDTFAAWVPDLWQQLKNARVDRKNHEGRN